MIFRNEDGSLKKINRSEFILNKEYYNAICFFILGKKEDEVNVEKQIKDLINSKVVNS